MRLLVEDMASPLRTVLWLTIVVLFTFSTTVAAVASVVIAPNMAAPPCHGGTGSGDDLDDTANPAGTATGLPVSHACCLNACIPLGLSGSAATMAAGSSTQPSSTAIAPLSSHSQPIELPPPKL